MSDRASARNARSLARVPADAEACSSREWRRSARNGPGSPPRQSSRHLQYSPRLRRRTALGQSAGSIPPSRSIRSMRILPVLPFPSANGWIVSKRQWASAMRSRSGALPSASASHPAIALGTSSEGIGTKPPTLTPHPRYSPGPSVRPSMTIRCTPRTHSSVTRPSWRTSERPHSSASRQFPTALTDSSGALRRHSERHTSTAIEL